MACLPKAVDSQQAGERHVADPERCQQSEICADQLSKVGTEETGEKHLKACVSNSCDGSCRVPVLGARQKDMSKTA